MEKENNQVGIDGITNDIPAQTNGNEVKKHNKLCSKLFDSNNPKLIKISKWLSIALLIAATVIYVVLGCTMHNWAKTWMIFIFVPVIPSILVSIAKKQLNTFCIAFLITGIYCAIGMNLRIWHPTWAMFFGIIVYHIIATWIDKKAIAKNSKNN